MILFALLAALPLSAAVEFNRDVRPILSDRCFFCHGPDPTNRQAGLRLDQESAAKAALKSGKRALAPGDPQHSELYVRIASSNKALRMPPAYAGHDALTASQVAVIRQWIEEGAPWQKHWAFIPPVKPQARGIDQIVRARLKAEGLQLRPQASKQTLLRRLSFDLTGLPPTPAELKTFLEDQTPNAYERQVDRLLASPRYAERMTIRWLEAARYADTNGYQSDGERSMWRWRDWVLNAFHTNMPFDRFTVEQIAGDLLPNATLDQKIASGFHRNHRTNAEGGIVEEEFRVEYVADRVETTSTVFLGLTLGCARCHDHKYDPFTQKEFYQLFAFYNNTPDRGLVYNFGNEEPYIKAPTPEHTKKLAEFDTKLRAAEQRWNSLQPRLAKEQQQWESTVTPFEWQITDGHVVTRTLNESDRRFDGQRILAAPDIEAKFSYMDPFTFAAWIKPEAENGTILSKTEDYWEGEGHQWFLHEGKLRLHITRRFTDISLRLETKTKVKLNEWQHVAITYDGYRKGAGVKIYINGESQPIDILFDELTYPLGPKDPWRIGAGPGPKYNFRGDIKSISIYKAALSPEQVSTLPLTEPVSAITAIPARQRTAAQAHKLRFCFIDRGASAEIKDSLKALETARRERTKYDESIPTVMIMAENPTPRESFILKRGAYDAHGEKVQPGLPASLAATPVQTRNRLDLARWLTHRNNPLTARVTVNRYWQMLFGAGLVKTSEDFGSQGEWPIYADLLDWLAVEFMDSGWNVKHLLKTIVMSETYRQDSTATPELLQKDPENRLLARGSRMRLSAEMIRDQALAVSGLLVEKLGGPSVKPYQPPGLWQELSGGRYTPDKGEGLYRRSIYSYWKRTIAPPSMINFDSPTRENCTVRETRTNTPLQALNLMNDVTYLEAARKLAERLIREGGATAADRIRYGFQLVLAREPQPREAEVLARALDRFQSKYAAAPQSAADFLKQGEAPVDASLDTSQLAAYANVASLLLNLDETVTKE